jgi:tetratricopeptide (TPR) repeat protein
LQRAKENLLKGVDFSERVSQLLWDGVSHWGLGITLFDMEDYKNSRKHFEKVIFLYRKERFFPSMVNYCRIFSARAKVMENEKDISLNDLFKCQEDIKFRIFEGSGQNSIGEILLYIDDQHISEAQDWIKKAIETHKNYGMMWHLARDYALYAELFTRKDDLPKAREKISKAIEIFKECGADGWVEKYEKELATLS